MEGILSGIGKVANFVTKYVSPILSMIPSPLTQGISAVANTISGMTQGAQPQTGADATAQAAAAPAAPAEAGQPGAQLTAVTKPAQPQAVM
jgi:hypothetical protein